MQNTLFLKKVAKKFAYIKKKPYLCTVKLKKTNLLTIKNLNIMTKYVYVVESSTEKSNFGFKVFSSYKSAKRFTKMLPQLKHKIIQTELLNKNSF